MKITHVLFKNLVGRMTKFHWYIQGKIKVIPTQTEKILRNHGYEVFDIMQYLNPPKKLEKVNLNPLYDEELIKDNTHPDYKCEPCFIFKDEDVLIEGLEQAKTLTNTVEISEGLPTVLTEKENKLNLSDEIHSEIKKKIKLSCMFEAKQELLPKRKDPLRPTWNFNREFGITEYRRNDLLCKNLTTICEQTANNDNNKSVILDAFFSSSIQAHNKKIQFELSSELVVTTQKKLKVLAEASSTYDIALPKLEPVDCTVSLRPYNFYTLQDIYPPGINSKWPYVQMAFVHFNPSQVKNVIEEEVTESQIQGRSLLKGFNIAVAEAHSMFGCDIDKLPEPVVVPVVQTDGKMFHFTIFQLNTLDLDKNSRVKNIFWNSERIPLYSECQYKAGRPVLEGYNPDIIRKLLTFYNID